MSTDSVADKNIAVWKVKKLIKSLEMARGYLLYFFICMEEHGLTLILGMEQA
jgi:hypothetical protein